MEDVGDRPFAHEALFYDGIADLAYHATAFLREGLRRGEPALVAVPRPQADALNAALGGDAAFVHFVDMETAGRNPGRIIPALEGFLRGHPGRAVRGIGEPLWDARRPEEIVECQLHESLVNAAFADRPGLSLLCPYDVGVLDPLVLREARCSHPVVREGPHPRPSREFRGPWAIAPAAELPLAPPTAASAVLSFDGRSFADVRRFAAGLAARAALDPARAEDFTLAVHEIAANSVRHGGGAGILRGWLDAGAVVCEVRDRGRIDDPLVGRRPPAPEQLDGRGVWLANQLCDLVQIRSDPDGTVVRLTVRP